MAERLVVLRSSRVVVIGGAALALVCVILSLALWRPAPLLVAPIGLLVIAAPLLARLDAVELDGRWLRVRRGFRWVGPVDLGDLVALAFLPATPRRPAVWLLIQRAAGARFRWYWRANVERELRDRLADDRDLRVVEVAAGGALATAPGLAEHLARYVSASAALVEPRARAALAQRQANEPEPPRSPTGTLPPP